MVPFVSFIDLTCSDWMRFTVSGGSGEKKDWKEMYYYLFMKILTRELSTIFIKW